MLTNIDFGFLKVTNSQNVHNQHQCIANNGLQQNSIYFVLQIHTFYWNTTYPHFLVNTYLIFFNASKPFLVLFPLSGGPSPLPHFPTWQTPPVFISNASSLMSPSMALSEFSHPCPPPPILSSRLLPPLLTWLLAQTSLSLYVVIVGCLHC